MIPNFIDIRMKGCRSFSDVGFQKFENSAKQHSESNTVFNTLTGDGEYFRHGKKNLPLPIQMQWSKKPKKFSCYFIAFLESKLNFEHFETKINFIAEVFLKLLTPKGLVF